MGPGVHRVGGPVPGERRAVHMWARGTRAAPVLARGVLTLVVVTGEAANRYLKEELLWLISTLTP